MRTLREIWAFARSKSNIERRLDAVYSPPIPSPYDVALVLAPAYVMWGKYENPDAAIAAAWWGVPAFYLGAAEYNKIIAPGLLGAGPAEGEQAGEPMHNTELQGI